MVEEHFYSEFINFKPKRTGKGASTTVDDKAAEIKWVTKEAHWQTLSVKESHSKGL